MKIGPKMWPLECSQGFSMIWPTDLVTDPTSPIFELHRDIVKMIILSKFDEDWTKNVAFRVFTRFFHDLTYWPSYWPNVTHIELNWDIVKMISLSKFDEDWTKNVASRGFTRFFHGLTYWPSFWPNIIHIRTWLRDCSFWASMIKIGPKCRPQECSQGFSMIWPTDLVFYPTSPIFELDWDIVKMIILSKFDEDWTKTLASRVFTRFFHDLTYWPSFWPNVTHIRT